MKSLLWWVNSLPLVLEDVCTFETRYHADLVKEAWFRIALKPNGIRLAAEVCGHLDKWLEVPDVCLSDSLLEGSDSAILLDAAMRLVDASEFSPLVIKALRTLLVGLKKWSKQNDLDTLEETPTGRDQRDPRDKAAIDNWVAIQAELERVRLEGELLVSVVAKAKSLIAAVLVSGPPEDDGGRIGPGAVYEGKTFNSLVKWDDLWGRYCPRDCLITLPDVLRNQLPDAKLTSRDCMSCGHVARLTAVPKDLWKKRLISVEPNVLQYQQQQARSCLISDMMKHPFTRHLRLSDQGRQQELAKLGCINPTGSSEEPSANLPEAVMLLDCGTNSDLHYSRPATLDFSDASDRVTWDLVQALLPTEWVYRLGSIRSHYAEDGVGGAKHRILSYAGMGNGTTFVVETLVFWAITAAYGCLLLPGVKTEWMCSHVAVYGDDVIIPTELAAMTNLFEVYKLLGWKVNADKSFFRPGGQFRESCGVHAFRGIDVTPVRIAGYDTEMIEERIALSQKVSQLADCYPTLAALVHTTAGIPNGCPVTNSVWIDVPYLEKTDPPPSRWNEREHKVEYLVPSMTPHKRRRARGGQGLLLAWFNGFSYVTYLPESVLDRARMAVKAYRADLGTFEWGRRKPDLEYVATVPRRVTEVKRWLPATSWGVGGEPAVIMRQYAPFPPVGTVPSWIDECRDLAQKAALRLNAAKHPVIGA